MSESGAEKLRRYREAAHLSQEDLAERVGVTLGAVSQWETGRTTPRRTVASKVDRLVGAGGEVLLAFGYSAPDLPPDVTAQILSRLDAVEAALEERVLVSQAEQALADLQQLRQVVEQLQDEVARLSDRRAAGRRS